MALQDVARQDGIQVEPAAELSAAALNEFVEAAEPAAAAINLICFLLLRSAPGDRLPQASPGQLSTCLFV